LIEKGSSCSLQHRPKSREREQLGGEKEEKIKRIGRLKGINAEKRFRPTLSKIERAKGKGSHRKKKAPPSSL